MRLHELIIESHISTEEELVADRATRDEITAQTLADVDAANRQVVEEARAPTEDEAILADLQAEVQPGVGTTPK